LKQLTLKITEHPKQNLSKLGNKKCGDVNVEPKISGGNRRSAISRHQESSRPSSRLRSGQVERRTDFGLPESGFPAQSRNVSGSEGKPDCCVQRKNRRQREGLRRTALRLYDDNEVCIGGVSEGSTRGIESRFHISES
jgi:hypothetical protein